MMLTMDVLEYDLRVSRHEWGWGVGRRQGLVRRGGGRDLDHRRPVNDGERDLDNRWRAGLVGVGDKWNGG